MHMSYTKNPNLPKLRADAVKLVRSGKGVREVARYYGYSPGTISKWCQKVESEGLAFRIIPTMSSRPKHHPNQIPDHIVELILRLRKDTKRGAEYIHQLLLKQGIKISLSSVKRTLSRHELTKYSKWKKWHKSIPRPLPEYPGLLMETDTIHDGPCGEQIYLYTIIDVNSRWAYAEVSESISAVRSSEFIAKVNKLAPFKLKLVQSDHGSEFSKYFTKKLSEPKLGLEHRYTRIRKPNDNAHIERFNRSIQEECTSRIYRDLNRWKEEVPKYIEYYNNERMHMALNWKTPMQVVQESKLN